MSARIFQTAALLTYTITMVLAHPTNLIIRQSTITEPSRTASETVYPGDCIRARFSSLPTRLSLQTSTSEQFNIIQYKSRDCRNRISSTVLNQDTIINNNRFPICSFRVNSDFHDGNDHDNHVDIVSVTFYGEAGESAQFAAGQKHNCQSLCSTFRNRWIAYSREVRIQSNNGHNSISVFSDSACNDLIAGNVKDGTNLAQVSINGFAVVTQSFRIVEL